MVYQQIRALSILDTAKARQKGYPLRISFSEFLRRYAIPTNSATNIDHFPLANISFLIL